MLVAEFDPSKCFSWNHQPHGKIQVPDNSLDSAMLLVKRFRDESRIDYTKSFYDHYKERPFYKIYIKPTSHRLDYEWCIYIREATFDESVQFITGVELLV